MTGKPVDPVALAEVGGIVQAALRRIAAGVDAGLAVRDACLEAYERGVEAEHTPVHFYPQLLDELRPQAEPAPPPPPPPRRSGVQPAAPPGPAESAPATPARPRRR